MHSSKEFHVWEGGKKRARMKNSKIKKLHNKKIGKRI
jgi:hypothetical protein